MTFLVMLLMPFLIQLRRKMWGPQFIMMSLDDGNVKPRELTDFQISIWTWRLQKNTGKMLFSLFPKSGWNGKFTTKVILRWLV